MFRRASELTLGEVSMAKQNSSYVRGPEFALAINQEVLSSRVVDDDDERNYSVNLYVHDVLDVQ